MLKPIPISPTRYSFERVPRGTPEYLYAAIARACTPRLQREPNRAPYTPLHLAPWPSFIAVGSLAFIAACSTAPLHAGAVVDTHVALGGVDYWLSDNSIQSLIDARVLSVFQQDTSCLFVCIEDSSLARTTRAMLGDSVYRSLRLHGGNHARF